MWQRFKLVMMKGIWRAVWSRVIAGLIVAGLIAVGSYFLHWWAAIGHGALVAFTFLGAKTPVWNWLLGLVGIVVVVVLVIVVSALIAAKQEVRNPLTAYTTDDFCGVRWQWHYGPNWRIENLNSFCPKCGLQIFMLKSGAYAVVPKVIFSCEECEYTTEYMGGPAAVVESLVTRLIQRNLRQGRLADNAKNVEHGSQP